MFSSLQSKSVFSYLFSLTFIQKQFSDISFGPICNGRKATPHSWAGPVTAHRSGSRAPADVCGVSSFRSVPKVGPVTDISYRILRSYEEKKIISTIKWLGTCSYLYWSLSLPSYGSRLLMMFIGYPKQVIPT